MRASTGTIFPATNEYAKMLADKIEAAKNLTGALYVWLTAEMNYEMAQLSSLPTPVIASYDPLNELAQAQTSLDNARERKAQMDAALNQIPDELSSVAGVLRLTMTQPLDQEITYIEQAIQRIQAELEKQQHEAGA